VEVDQLLQRLDVVREAVDDGLELVARLVAEPVLPEDASLGEVLPDELLVVGGQRSRELDGRRRGRRRGGGGSGCRHGRRCLKVDLEATLALLLAQPAQLRAVLLVVGLELHQHLEDGGGLVQAALREVGLDHLRVGLRDEHVVPRLAVELDELREGAHVLRVLLDDLLEQGGAAVDLAFFDELVDRGKQLVVRFVEAALREAHLSELLAGLDVGRVALEESFEHTARVGPAAGAEAGLGEAKRGLAVVGRGAARLLQVGHRLREVLLDEVDARGGGEQPRAAGDRLPRLVEHGQGLGEEALLHELVGDRAVLASRLLAVALARVEIGETDADLQVGGIDVRHPLQDLARLAHLVALLVLLEDERVGLLRLRRKLLAGVEVAEADVALEHRRVVAQHLLPQGDRLEVEAVVGEEPGDLDVLLVRGLGVVELRVKVADPVDRVPVPRVVLDDLLQGVDRPVEAAGLLRRIGVLLQLDLVDLGH
jgi:hypothetical protein